MQNKISKTITTDQIRVSLPFALKDSFKSTFKTAKWDNFSKTWNIKNSAVSTKKLDAWIAEVDGSGVIDALNAVDEEEMDQKTIQAIQIELKEIRDSLSNTVSAEKRHKTIDLLAVVRTELNAEREKRNAAQAQAKDQKSQIEEYLGALVDLGEMRNAYATMRRTHNGVGSNCRTDFNSAQSTLVDFYNMLNKYGFHSKTLDSITDANFNRPERDNLTRYPFEKIFDDLVGDADAIMRIAVKSSEDTAASATPKKI